MSAVAQIVRIPFQGTDIHTVLVDGDPHVVIRPTIEGMGLDYSTQLQKLKTRSWATVGQSPTVAEDGKVRVMATVSLDTWAMLLANIDENRVAESVRPLLVEYGRMPGKADRFVDGALRSVYAYTEADRPLFEQVWHALAATAARAH